MNIRGNVECDEARATAHGRFGTHRRCASKAKRAGDDPDAAAGALVSIKVPALEQECQGLGRGDGTIASHFSLLTVQGAIAQPG